MSLDSHRKTKQFILENYNKLRLSKRYIDSEEITEIKNKYNLDEKSLIYLIDAENLKYINPILKNIRKKYPSIVNNRYITVSDKKKLLQSLKWNSFDFSNGLDIDNIVKELNKKHISKHKSDITYEIRFEKESFIYEADILSQKVKIRYKSIDDLKKHVLSYKLPWDDKQVPIVYFNQIQICAPEKYISNPEEFRNDSNKLSDLIVNKNQIRGNETKILNYSDKIINSANKLFIEKEKEIILNELNKIANLKNDYIDKSDFKSKCYRDYFDYYSDLNIDKKIDVCNSNIAKRNISKDFSNKYISPSDASKYKKDNNISFDIESIIKRHNLILIKKENKCILDELNKMANSNNDYIDKSTFKSNMNYSDHNSDFIIDEKIDEANFKIAKRKIPKDFSDKYISYSQGCKYKNDNDFSFDIEPIIEKHNSNFIEKQMKTHQSYFDNINGKSLDDNQRIAVLTDDDSNQIVAGAGTGKTLTIQAKVKYLIEKENINPEDILCISFSNSARDDLADKLNSTIDVPVEVRTFHSLGYSILGRNDEYKEVPDYEVKNFIDDYFKKLFFENPNLLKDIIKFFCYYFNIIYLNETDLKLETIKSRLTRLDEYDEFLKEYLEVASVQRNREYMNNIPELVVANYLFAHNIAYEHGNQALFKDKNYDKYLSKYSSYLFDELSDEIPDKIKLEFITEFDNEFACEKLDFYPSFFLPNDDIYIDLVSQVHDWKTTLDDDNAKKKINDCLEKRKSLNKSYKTKILTIFDYGDDIDNLLNEVSEHLLENNVNIPDVDYEKLYDLLILQDNLLEYRSFINTVNQFINLFKGNAKNIDYDGNDISSSMFESYFAENNENYSGSIQKRNKLYLTMIKKVYDVYRDFFKENDYIDFNDMINDAVIKLRNGAQIPNYKYVIVDEYQDTSFTRYSLLKEIQNVTGAKVVVVGDDWQSIYGFTGCNVNLFSHFDEYFEHPKMVKINVTRRNSQRLIDVVGEFVSLNHNQIPKKLLSEKIENEKPIKIFEYNSRAEEVLALINILNKISEEKSDAEVLILGRNNRDVYEISCKQIFETTPFKDYTRIDYSLKPNLDITFRTVHKSKGLQADYVVVLNLNNQINGFPNKIVNDVILDFVTDKEDEGIKYPEERRLFYVALTRTQNDVYLFSKSARPSYFVNEIKSKKGVELLNFTFSNDDIIRINHLLEKKYDVIATNNKCPKCDVGQINLILNNEKGTSYFKCSNFCGWNGGPYHNSDFRGDTQRQLSHVKYSQVCSKCNHMLIVKKSSAKKYFLGCNTWPECSNSKNNIPGFKKSNELILNILNINKKEDLNRTPFGVYYINEYIPKDKISDYEGDERIDFSNQILSFKDGIEDIVFLLTKDLMKFISYISKFVVGKNIDKLALIAVPSSKVKKINRSSMRKSIDYIEKWFKNGELITEYECNKEIINLKDLIKRVKDVPTAHLGEGRSTPEEHIDSMECSEGNLSNENIAYIILDDITTTGNTMKACNEILLNNGVNERNIYNITIGATVGDYNEEI